MRHETKIKIYNSDFFPLITEAHEEEHELNSVLIKINSFAVLYSGSCLNVYNNERSKKKRLSEVK